ncbi:HAMP domain-containing protein [Neokomagataea tanensis]|uniref:histidine kinase n=3 Tax=Acetobacteraceae TaxID=433 RepID=A0A4Y6V6N1_9PROT|nr:HAMP domain-containing protein [Neokomagataea tanensis]
MLIVLVPLLVTQSIVLALFYGTYLHTVSRRLSGGVTGEIMLVTSSIAVPMADPARANYLAEAQRTTQLQFRYLPNERLAKHGTNHIFGPIDDVFARTLQQRLGRPFLVEWFPKRHIVDVRIQLPGGVLGVYVPSKRLSIGPIWVFVVWVSSTSVLLFVIAGIFMRNQVRAVRRLAHAAELFGLGRDAGAIRPQGAREVRQAAVAFNRMRERVNRFVAQRTSVLAGVSHDLRTPLARLRLSLAMLPSKGMVKAEDIQADVSDMVQDLVDMERLIESYLSFARGEGAEKPVPTDINRLLNEVATATERSGGRVVEVVGCEEQEVLLRPDAMWRAVSNLADNARRHGGSSVRFEARMTQRWVEITVEDAGPGLDSEKLEEARQRLASGSRLGNGLGLTIVRDVVQAHGGFMRLDKSKLGGLSVTLSLPR